jgi:hypothetical protein
MDIGEIGCGGVDRICLASERDKWICESGNERSDSIVCWEIIERLHKWWPLE